MFTAPLDTLDATSLRALALEAWRRMERAEREAEAKAREAEVERQRALRLRAENQELSRKNGEFKGKAEALEVEVEVLLKRITKLTRELAQAKGRDAQLELEFELKRLRERLGEANRERFGSRSERRGRQEEAGEDEAEKKRREKRKKKRGHGPTDQPRLEFIEQPHTLEEDACTCPSCGARLDVMEGQFEESELISVVEVKYVVTLNKRQKYRCSTCGHIETAPGPLRLLPGGRYDLDFTIQVALDKYLSHLPLEQQVTRMGRRGLRVTSQTLWDQLFALYVVLLPTYLALQDKVLSQALVFVDETPWRVMGQGGRRRSGRWWLWTLASTAGVYFHILPTRGAAAAKELLRDFDGILMADGYSVYASLEKALERKGGAQLDLGTGEPEVLPNYTLAGCWMHARRFFYKAERSGPGASTPLDLIARLYAIEARARELADGDSSALLEHRLRLRDTESRAVIEELKLWRDAQRVLPGTHLAKGVTYLKNQWGPLTLFLDYPMVPLDNGEAERQIRGPVLGRKRYGGSQSDRGTRVAGLLFSLLHSAVAAGVDPGAYLREATRRALLTPGAVLLPQDSAAELSEGA